MAKIYRIVNDLLSQDEHYILPMLNAHGTPIYRMYIGNMNPKYNIRPKTYKQIRHLVKRDNKGRLTLNLSLVRQLHGNNWIKKAYKNHAKKRQLPTVS